MQGCIAKTVAKQKLVEGGDGKCHVFFIVQRYIYSLALTKYKRSQPKIGGLHHHPISTIMSEHTVLIFSLEVTQLCSTVTLSAVSCLNRW